MTKTIAKKELLTKLNDLQKEYDYIKAAFEKDITERKLTEEQLNESEQKYKMLFESNTDGITIFAMKGDELPSQILDMNQNSYKMLGYSREEMLMMNPSELEKDVTREKIEKRVLDFKTKGFSNFETRLRHKNGFDIYVEIKGIIVNYNNQLALMNIVCDITERKAVEEALRESEFELDNAERMAKMGNWIVIATNPSAPEKLYWSKEMYRIVNRNPSSFTPTLAAQMDLLVSEDAGKLAETVAHSMMTGEPYDIELQLKNEEGRDAKWIRSHSEMVYDENGGINGMRGTAQDITQRKLAEEKLRLKNVVFDVSIAAKSIADFNGIITEANSSFLQVWGYQDKNEVIGKPISFFLVDPAVANSIVTTLNNTGEWTGDYIAQKRDGSTFVAHGLATVVKNELGEIIAYQSSVIDISESRKSEAELEESREKYRGLSEAAFESIFISENGICIDQNKTAEKMFGYTSEEAIGRYGTEWIAPQDREMVMQHMLEGYEEAYEAMALKKDGTIFPCILRGKMMHYKGRTVRVTSLSDNTYRKQAEDKLKVSEQLYRTLFDFANEGLILLTMDGKIAELNQSFAEMHGYTVDEMKNMDIKDLDVLRENAFDGRAAVMQRLFDGEVVRFEVEHYHKKGHSFFLSDTVSLITIAEQQYFLAFHQDITERKQAAEKIREKDFQFRKLSANLPDLIFQFTRRPDGSYCVPIASEGIRNIFGCSPEDVVDDFTPIAKVIYPDDAEQVIRDIEYSAEHLTYFTCEFRVQIPGKPIQWIFSRSTPEKLPDGSVTWYGFNADITERKKAEQKVLESQEELKKFATHLLSIREEERIMLAREIHDDLGQILVALQIDMGLLKKNVIKTIPLSNSPEIEPKFDKIVALIKNSIKSARSIMNNLRPEFLELLGLVGAAKEYLREFEERYSISCKFECDISDIEMSMQQSLALFRILQEAMNNIVKHAKATLVVVQLQTTNNKLILQISDNGVGFDKNNSVRNDSYGMIGMKERVILLEGELDITSEIGLGTTIRVEIPH